MTEQEIQAVLDEALAARRAEAIRRAAERRAVRERLKARRDPGLAARHAQKLNRAKERS